MSALSLRAGAHALMGAADQLSLTASSLGGRSVTSAVRTEAKASLDVGAAAVRSLGGPYFHRMADHLTAQATRVEGGGPIQPAIDAAMEGASYLLRRASNR